jgi:hypothetical protein
MRAASIVEVEVAPDRLAGVRHAIVSPQVDLLLALKAGERFRLVRLFTLRLPGYTMTTRSSIGYAR